MRKHLGIIQTSNDRVQHLLGHSVQHGIKEQCFLLLINLGDIDTSCDGCLSCGHVIHEDQEKHPHFSCSLINNGNLFDTFLLKKKLSKFGLRGGVVVRA